jgi:hypothetical protein
MGLLGAICACVLLGVLAAGLWPFHAPSNEVSWLTQGNGIRFGKYGSIVSEGTFNVSTLQTDDSCSIEIWVRPSRSKLSGTILAFYWSTQDIVPFALRQSLSDLELEFKDQNQPTGNVKIYTEDIFGAPKPVFLTISSGRTGTSIYADGILVKQASNGFVRQDITGQLIIGNAPATTHNWSGQLRALAIYDRELSASEVAEHFTDWRKGNLPQLAAGDGVVASYPFDEGKGRVVHNRADSSMKLLIPERFFVLREQFLERPWDEFRPDWNYWKDVGINIVGFIPLGFFFRALFSVIRKDKRASWLTVVLGFAVSLTIEVLQAFLPTRDSGMTDLFTNTLGTGLGVTLCVWGMKLNWFSRVSCRR